MSLVALDMDYRLTPWLHAEHAMHVSGRYGQLLGTQGKEAADEYVEEYMQREKADDAAYELQKEQLRVSSKQANAAPQELADKEKLDWDPREKVAEAAGEAPKKRGRPTKVKEEEVKPDEAVA